MTTRVALPVKLAGEILTLLFPFTLEVGETLLTQSVSVSVYSGTDAAPSAILSGSASHSGYIVQQKVTGGLAGVIYYLLCAVTTSNGQTLQCGGYLAVVPAT